ncbi:MAG: DUF1343 domain-containing protein [Fimbriimonadaceae bacterium]|nr:DUF1343 domain-containing protein [Fimbriimonadaceae bacterium]
MLATAAAVLCGLDVLIRDEFRPLRGLRIGLITNHTGRARDGRHIVDILTEAPGVQVKALFAPEHGIRGEKDEAIADEKDARTGLPIYSLYNLKEQGEARYRPNPEQLKGLDALVFDIQDIGARFYTYTSTMGFCMEAAAAQGLKFFVLDRPNPITGLNPEGPVSQPEFRGHTAFHPIPVRHAMTAGELAMMYRDQLKLDLDLTVVWAEGWKRSMWWDETGLAWIDPSPNMRSLHAATLYTGICLLEASNISVGRGTDTPFERFGAPYIDGVRLAAELNAARIPGVRFYPVRFTPDASRFANQECGGVYVVVTDRNRLRPVRMGLVIAQTLHRMYPEWEEDRLVRLLQNRPAAESILRPAGARDPREWSAGMSEFRKLRERFLHAGYR